MISPLSSFPLRVTICWIAQFGRFHSALIASMFWMLWKQFLMSNSAA